MRYLVLVASFGLFISLPPLADAQDARPRRMRPDREVLVRTPPPVEDPAPAPEAPKASAAPVIAEDGAVETTLPDGSVKRAKPGDCGWTIVHPNGKKNTIACLQVQRSNLPAPEGASATFLDAHGESLLQIARTLLGSNAASLDNYLKTVESENPNVYDRIRLRTELITKLTGK